MKHNHSKQESERPDKLKAQERESSEVRSKAVYSALQALVSDLGLKKSDLQEITGKSRSTVAGWFARNAVPVSEPVEKDMEPVLHLVAIHRNLYAMFSESENRRRWLHAGHPSLQEAPLSLMKRSLSGLIQVRAYLDYFRGRGA